jgi:hypothetical protein
MAAFFALIFSTGINETELAAATFWAMKTVGISHLKQRIPACLFCIVSFLKVHDCHRTFVVLFHRFGLLPMSL